MVDNFSRFKGATRPVERVSWDDVQGFMRRINKRIPGLDLVLPSEAQWERACWAGASTALYTTGPIELSRPVCSYKKTATKGGSKNGG